MSHTGQSTPTYRTVTRSGQRLREDKRRVEFRNEDLATLVQQLAVERGLTIPQDGRFGHFFRALASPGESADLRIRAVQELDQLHGALTHLRDLQPWLSKLEEAVTYDAVKPKEGGIAPTRGRDTLFEVYAAARFAAIGIPSTQAEPDILCDSVLGPFGIAAKRVKSRKKILQRVNSAANQIAASGFPGIIALDLSPLEGTYYRKFPVETFDEFQSRAIAFLNKEFEPNLSHIQRTCAGKPIIGVIAFATVGGLLHDNQRTILVSRGQSGRRMCEEHSPTANLFWDIVDRLGDPEKAQYRRIIGAR